MENAGLGLFELPIPHIVGCKSSGLVSVGLTLGADVPDPRSAGRAELEQTLRDEWGQQLMSD